jgi:hypothetical protein
MLINYKVSLILYRIRVYFWTIIIENNNSKFFICINKKTEKFFGFKI